MKPRTERFLIIGSIVLVLILLGIFREYKSRDEYGYQGVKSEEGASASRAYSDSVRKAQDTVVYTITAPELHLAYEENEVRADRVLKGKKIEAVGRISKIRKDFEDKTHVHLAVDKWGFHDVDCLIPEDWALYMHKGQPAHIQGRCKGMWGGIVLIDAMPK